MSQQGLFPGMDDAAPEPALIDPVERMLTVKRDAEHNKAVIVILPDKTEHWIARSLIRFDGLGLQRVRIERWKAAELGLSAVPAADTNTGSLNL